MSPKKRKSYNKKLPSRWRFKHGSYYYRVPPGMEEKWDNKTEFRLGATLSDSYKEWASRIELHVNAKTIGDLLERYELEEVPKKAAKTQESYTAAIRKIRPIFGHMLITELKTIHVFQYRDRRGKVAPTACNHEVGVLSHAYSKAIEWGLSDENPIKGKVRKIATKPRDRYVEDWELDEALTVASPLIKAYVNLRLQLGLRRGDMLRIKNDDLLEEGISVIPSKTQDSTGKKIIYQWTEELRFAVNEVKNLTTRIQSEWLFCTRKGKCYMNENGRSNSFDSVWNRFMAKALKETKLKNRFTEHDLRAKAASDTDLAHAQKLLGHSSPVMTERVYRRKTEIILPAKGRAGK